MSMIEVIKKLDSSLLEIQPMIDYLRQFEKGKIVSEEIETDNGEVKMLCEEEFIRIIFLKITYGTWWSFYRYHFDGTKYEQVDAILYDKPKENGCNRNIKFSGHIEDNDYSYITCSSFCYFNSDLLWSWKQTRVVPIQDLCKIQYSKSMNLTELVCMTDAKSSNIIKKKEQKNLKVLDLKLRKL